MTTISAYEDNSKEERICDTVEIIKNQRTINFKTDSNNSSM